MEKLGSPWKPLLRETQSKLLQRLSATHHPSIHPSLMPSGVTHTHTHRCRQSESVCNVVRKWRFYGDGCFGADAGQRRIITAADGGVPAGRWSCLLIGGAGFFFPSLESDDKVNQRKFDWLCWRICRFYSLHLSCLEYFRPCVC